MRVIGIMKDFWWVVILHLGTMNSDVVLAVNLVVKRFHMRVIAIMKDFWWVVILHLGTINSVVVRAVNLVCLVERMTGTSEGFMLTTPFCVKENRIDCIRASNRLVERPVVGVWWCSS